MCHMTEYYPGKTGNTQVIFRSFQNHVCCKKYLMDNKLSSLRKLSLYMYCKLCNDIESNELYGLIGTLCYYVMLVFIVQM